tara:strand:+ start:19278 stop:19853 length:576 start_codon:yes stop_codon:yes gene_type:complete
MKKGTFYFLIGILISGTIAFVSIDKNVDTTNDFVKNYSKILESMKTYTLQVAEAMPADKYTFKPTDSVRSFGEQLAHLGMSSKFLLDVFIKDEKVAFDPYTEAETEQRIGASKEEAIALITSSLNEVIATLKGMDSKSLNKKFTVVFDPKKPEFTKKEGFEFIRDHITHHRAQALVSLRMQGVKAPSYRFY